MSHFPVGVACAPWPVKRLTTNLQPDCAARYGGGRPLHQTLLLHTASLAGRTLDFMTLSLTSLSVRHPGADQSALQQLTLAIDQGEQVALIGPSGAGKTTLLHTLALAQQPTTGTLMAFGGNPWALNSSQRHVLRGRLFLAPQTPPLPPRQRVVTAVLAGRLSQWRFWRAVASLVRPTEPQLAFDALARFNLQHKLYARVDRLSGGERQRCGMARLLVSDARLLLVDEPLSALDPTLAVQTMDVLQAEATRRNATLICSLHQVALARAHFPRIVGLRDGRIVFDARREDVTDLMVDALYQNAGNAAVLAATRFKVDEDGATLANGNAPTVVLVPRC